VRIRNWLCFASAKSRVDKALSGRIGHILAHFTSPMPSGDGTPRHIVGFDNGIAWHIIADRLE
jgi:hypothetical protein